MFIYIPAVILLGYEVSMPCCVPSCLPLCCIPSCLPFCRCPRLSSSCTIQQAFRSLQEIAKFSAALVGCMETRKANPWGPTSPPVLPICSTEGQIGDPGHAYALFWGGLSQDIFDPFDPFDESCGSLPSLQHLRVVLNTLFFCRGSASPPLKSLSSLPVWISC